MTSGPFTGYCDKYSLDELKELLNNGADMSSVEIKYRGWIFWGQQQQEGDSSSSANHGFGNNSSTTIHEKIKFVLQEIILATVGYFLVQFWSPRVAAEGSWYLTTSDQPFALGNYGLCKGLCWYRKVCMDHAYYVGEGGTEEEVGTGYPESSPDLRLYSTKEHPLRDVAVSCGLRGYVALPVFDLLQNQCLGVLELILYREIWEDAFRILEQALKKAHLRSTHVNFYPLNKNPKYKKPPPEEIGEMLELAIEVIPQLHLAQVWTPCTQCGNILSCMERAIFINSADMEFGSSKFYDPMMLNFLEACEFHHRPGVAGIVTGKSSFLPSLCDVSICEYPLAHYAQQARLSSCFTVCLESRCDDVNDLFIVEFFLQYSHSRVDAYPCSTLQLLLQIMKKKLQGFAIAPEQELTELLVCLCTKNTPAPLEPNRSPGTSEMIHSVQEHENSSEFTLISRTMGYDEKFQVSDLKEWLQDVEFSVLEDDRWVFWGPEREELLDCQSIQVKVKFLIMEIMSSEWCSGSILVQFWAVRRKEDKYFLTNLDQPFALPNLYKGLCWYRKQCMDQQYFVDDGAKEEELGPPGRVFRNRYPESSADLRLYSTKEFPHRDHAIRCGLQTYLALPVFNLHQNECVGVLECIGFKDTRINILHARIIRHALEVANLESPHFIVANLQREIQETNQESSLCELDEMLRKVIRISQLSFLAQVWVPCSHCTDTDKNLTCVKRELYKSYPIEVWGNYVEYSLICQSHKVQTGKGITGILLSLENKSGFFPNICRFSITEEPQAHHLQVDRYYLCFAICLQSSNNGNNLYVLQFFLSQASRKYELLCSFLSFLLPIMKETLKSFKLASGKQLGEELVVEVISFDKNDEFTSFELHQPDMLPVRFEVTQYNKEPRYQHSTNKLMHDTQNGQDSSETVPEAEPELNDAARANLEQGVTVTAKKTKGERNAVSFHISYEDLQLHFGKRLEDVAEELGVSRSTLKRACRDYGIKRWPSSRNNKKNPFLFETSTSNKRVRYSEQQVLISSSNKPPPQISPLHNQDVLQTSGVESNQNHTKLTEDGVVLIKAKFRDDTVKVQLLLSSGIGKLKEEVGKRFNLMNGSFKLYYFDEDEWIFLACDDDLQLCMKTLTGSGKTPIQILVKSICN